MIYFKVNGRLYYTYDSRERLEDLEINLPHTMVLCYDMDLDTDPVKNAFPGTVLMNIVYCIKLDNVLIDFKP